MAFNNRYCQPDSRAIWIGILFRYVDDSHIRHLYLHRAGRQIEGAIGFFKLIERIVTCAEVLMGRRSARISVSERCKLDMDE